MSSIVDRLKIFFERNEKFSAWLGLGSFFIYLILWALADGGTWVLYEPIAMADRWPDRYGYSKGAVDQFVPSTPYSPGVSLLAIFIPFKTYQVEVLLLIASSCVLILLGLLFFVYKKFDGERSAISYVTFSTLLSRFLLYPWLDFAKEFKPDTIALCFFILAFLSLTSFDKKSFRLIALIISVSMALLFKQQIIAPIIGLIIGCFVSKLSVAEKIKDALMVSVGLFVGAVVMFSIEGFLFYAVESHVGRAHISIIDWANIKLVVKLFIVFAFGFFTFGKAEFLYKISQPLKFYTYSIPMVLWLLAGIAGALNLGGDSGNTAVGVVLAIPILVLMCDKIKPWAMSIIFISFAFYCLISPVKNEWVDQYQKRLAVDSEVAQKIRDGHFKSALISSSSYMAVRNANLQQISSIDTWVHILMGINRDQLPKESNSPLDIINPDVVVCVFVKWGCEVYDSADWIKDDAFPFRPDKSGYKEVQLNSTSVKGVLYVRNNDSAIKDNPAR